ncbi:hypothetical protein [uncultured Mediterranean phage uvMED]|nr:hypothetical protein [uncultured Mediterranean phage uvMED]
MFKTLIKVSNHRAVDTCCPAFFTQKFKIFLKFSSNQIGEKIDRKMRKNAKQTEKETK